MATTQLQVFEAFIKEVFIWNLPLIELVLLDSWEAQFGSCTKEVEGRTPGLQAIEIATS